ncbi:MAG TPA: hypothetical protein VIJ25_05405 [Methylococcales bacterium]
MSKSTKCFIVVMVLAGLVLPAGCQTDAQRLQSSTITFTATVQALTVMRQAGSFTPQEANDITVFIHSGQSYLNQWQAANLKGEKAPGVISAYNAIIAELIRMQSSKK